MKRLLRVSFLTMAVGVTATSFGKPYDQKHVENITIDDVKKTEVDYKGETERLKEIQQLNRLVGKIARDDDKFLVYFNSQENDQVERIKKIVRECPSYIQELEQNGDIASYIVDEFKSIAKLAHEKLSVHTCINGLRLAEKLTMTPWYACSARYGIMRQAEELSKDEVFLSKNQEFGLKNQWLGTKDLYRRSRAATIKSVALVGSLTAAVAAGLAYVVYQKWFKKKNLNKLKQGQTEKK